MLVRLDHVARFGYADAYIKNRTVGSNPRCGFLTLPVDFWRGAVTAFSVFDWLQVTDFGFLLSLFHFSFPLLDVFLKVGTGRAGSLIIYERVV